jgi:hypothetical protein
MSLEFRVTAVRELGIGARVVTVRIRRSNNRSPEFRLLRGSLSGLTNLSALGAALDRIDAKVGRNSDLSDSHPYQNSGDTHD